MPLLKTLLRPVANALARSIASSPKLLEQFRSHDFFGKQFIAGNLNGLISVPDGPYRCHGLVYDIHFEDAIQRDIYLGVYERHERQFLSAYINPGWTCVDVGANVGFYTLLLASLVGERGRVLSIEASPTNFSLLSRNVALNGFPQCELTSVALTSLEGPIAFHTSPRGNSGWGRVGEWDAGVNLITVNGTTLDAFLQARHVSRVDFMKVDIEGHELSLVKGGQISLRAGVVRRLLVEYSGYVLEKQGVDLARYVAEYEQLGFRPCRLNVGRVEAAKRGCYDSCGETFNLLFEHDAVSTEA